LPLQEWQSYRSHQGTVALVIHHRHAGCLEGLGTAGLEVIRFRLVWGKTGVGSVCTNLPNHPTSQSKTKVVKIVRSAGSALRRSLGPVCQGLWQTGQAARQGRPGSGSTRQGAAIGQRVPGGMGPARAGNRRQHVGKVIGQGPARAGQARQEAPGVWFMVGWQGWQDAEMSGKVR
jgi:hypothetical protein